MSKRTLSFRYLSGGAQLRVRDSPVNQVLCATAPGGFGGAKEPLANGAREEESTHKHSRLQREKKYRGTRKEDTQKSKWKIKQRSWPRPLHPTHTHARNCLPKLIKYKHECTALVLSWDRKNVVFVRSHISLTFILEPLRKREEFTFIYVVTLNRFYHFITEITTIIISTTTL